MHEITKEIRKFLWQGGKPNGLKKFHLVNWDIVCSPKNCGGVGIRDLTMMNLALGAKILWIIVCRKKSQWKEILRKKYMKGASKRCVDEFPLTRNGYPIWNLCKKAIHIIKITYTRSSKTINGLGFGMTVWGLSLRQIILDAFAELKQWLYHLNINTLFDLSTWKNNGRWGGWKYLDVPEHLKFDLNALHSLLHGSAHAHCQLSNGKEWGK